MTGVTDTDSGWGSFARVNAGRRWRKASAAMGRQVTDAIVAEARIEAGMRVLDVACGTGEPAISIASGPGASGEVTGVDISLEPLKVAKERAGGRRLGNISFVSGDAHRLPFPDASFDRVTSRLGVMFFADLPGALKEMRRVLKPGGRVSLLAWGPMEQPYFKTTVGVVLRALGRAEAPAAGAAMFRYSRAGTLTAGLEKAGFEHVEERLAYIPWNWPGTPEDLWQYFQEVTIPFKPLFQAIPAERVAEVHGKVLAELTKRSDACQVRFDAAVVMASGRR